MFIFLDTETTGNEVDDRLCQIAFKAENEPAVNQLFNPGRPISIEAMSVHHITNAAVRQMPCIAWSPSCWISEYQSSSSTGSRG